MKTFPATFVLSAPISVRKSSLSGSFSTLFNSDRRPSTRGFISRRAFPRIAQQPPHFNVFNVKLVQANLSPELEEETDIEKNATETAQVESASTSTAHADSSTLSPSLSSSSSQTTNDSSPQTSHVTLQSSLETLNTMSDEDRAHIETTQECLELWLSAENLRRDWYLRRQMDDNGWLNPSVFLLFNRIKRINASLDDIIFAAQLSDDIEVSTPGEGSETFGDDLIQTRIRRSPLLPSFTEWDGSELEKSFLLKSIPHDSTVEYIQDLFIPHAKPTYVHLYRARNKPDVAPRALVCFDTKETADSVFDLFAKNAPAKADGILIRRRHLPMRERGNSIMAKANPSATEELLIMHLTNLPPAIDWKYLHRLLNEAVLLRAGRRARFLLYDPDATDAECFLTVTDGPAVRDMAATLEEKGLPINELMVNVRLLKGAEEIDEYWEKARVYNEKRRSRRHERMIMEEDDDDCESGNAKGSGERQRGNTSRYKNNINSRPKGVVAKITGLNPDLAWKKILIDLSKLTKVIYLNYQRGSDVCYVRASSTIEAQKFVYLLNGDEENAPYPVGGTIVQASLILGDEEDEYWNEVEERQRVRNGRLREFEEQLDKDEVKDTSE